MNEDDFRDEDSAFLKGVRSALEADACIRPEQVAAIRLAALRHADTRRARTSTLTRTVLRAAAALAVLTGLGVFYARPGARGTDSLTVQTIALIGEADGDAGCSLVELADAPAPERLLAWQDAPYLAVANADDFGDNSVFEF